VYYFCLDCRCRFVVASVTRKGRSSYNMTLRWDLDWLRGIPPSDPVLTELAKIPVVRNDGKTAFKLHRTHWPVLLPETRNRFPAPPSENVVDVPDGALRPYQKEAAEFSANRRGSLIALAMGCGKTRTALVAAGWGRGIVVSPLVAFRVWLKELSNVWGDIALFSTRSPTSWVDLDQNPVEAANRVKVQVVRGHFATGEKLMSDADVFIVNPELLRTRWDDLASLQPAWVIFDEAHYYINPKAQRQQGAAALANCLPNLRVITLTGTPILKHLANLYGILNVINPGGWGSWTEFTGRYAGGHASEWGWKLGEPSNVEELRARLKEVMFARAWHDVMDNIPAITRERCPITLDVDARKEYDKLATDIREVIRYIEAGDLNGAEHMQQVNALRRMVGLAKVKAAQELIRSCGEPVVVWTWHRDVAAAIAKPFPNAVVVTGAESRKKRDEKIDLFKSGSANVFVSTMAAGGLGIDLTNARITIQAEMSWTAADMSQAEGRVFRSGQMKPCVTYWLIAEDTIEQHIVEALWRKANFAAALGQELAGDRRMMSEVTGAKSVEALRDVEIAASLLSVIEKSFDLVGGD